MRKMVLVVLLVVVLATVMGISAAAPQGGKGGNCSGNTGIGVVICDSLNKNHHLVHNVLRNNDVCGAIAALAKVNVKC